MEDICGLMIKYYEELLLKNDGIKDGNIEEGFVYDLKSMRKRKIEEWQA